AFLLHRDVRERHDAYAESHKGASGRDAELLGLQEVFLQLVLGETGTACRATEQIVGRWLDEVDQDKRTPQWDEDDEDHWGQLMFQQLSIGVEIGGRALEEAAKIEQKHKFADKVTKDRLAMPTAFRNPAIMTARASLHLFPLSYEMEALGLRPGSGHDSWEAM